MDTLKKGIITLIKSSVTGQSLALPEGFSLEEAYPLIRRHSLITLAYDGAVRCGISRQELVMGRLFQGYCRAVQISEGQMRQIENICQAFDREGIDYMPLKGCNMKALYPAPELRMMGDADILIRMEQYDRIRSLLEAMGYHEKLESDHELIWEGAGLYLELHKRVVPSYDQEFYRYYGDSWKLAKQTGGTRFAMTPEDEWIYLFTHLTKHYRNGGVGIRHVTDLWVFRRVRTALDEDYIRGELEKMQLLEFYDYIQRLVQVWFGDAETDDRTEFLSQFIFNSGNWGDAESRLFSGIIRKSKQHPGLGKGRFAYALNHLFPGRNALEQKYTILQKAPWMLPAVWVYRPFYKLLFERNSLKRQVDVMNQISREEVDGKQAMLEYVGLDFHF